MKTLLKPQEYYYLYSPLRSDPIEMFKYTFQSLVVDEHIDIYYKAIFINKNEKYKRQRLFLKLGNKYSTTNSYTKAEEFILSLLKTQDELRPYEIKSLAMDELDDDIENFKSNYVYEDVKQLGFCFLKCFLTSKGREARNRYANLIEVIDKDIDSLLRTETILQTQLDELGTGIIFLEETTLNKLKKTIPNLDELSAMFEIITSASTYGGSGGYSGGSYGGGGSFGGYGGGSFGGGGSGGSW